MLSLSQDLSIFQIFEFLAKKYIIVGSPTMAEEHKPGLTNGHSGGGNSTAPSLDTNQTKQDAAAPSQSTAAVLKPSAPVPSTAHQVQGIEFNEFKDRDMTVAELVSGMDGMGFQASAVAEAADIINEMRSWRDPEKPDVRTTVFLGYTSNLVSSGLRNTIRYLVEHEHVSAIVTTAGGIEEDLIKCLAPTYLSSFAANGAQLRSEGMNRIGNLVVPNSNYCAFENWVIPILDKMLEEQESSKHFPDESEYETDPEPEPEPDENENEKPIPKRKPHHHHRRRQRPKPKRLVWTPSSVISRLGREVNDPSSICHQAYLHNIPIFCPALTDGSLGDMLHFHTFRTQPRFLDISITRDIRLLNDISFRAARAGMLIFGGGLVKHHIANACLMRNGADFAVYVNTAQEFDGSDAGARPDEAVSWGKIKSQEDGGRAVKVYGEATVVVPLLVAATYAKVHHP